MGNSSPSTTQAGTAQEESKRVMEAMSVLSDKSTTQAQRRPHFEWLRGHLAPDNSRSQAFSNELSRVFALRFQKWSSPPGSDAWSPELKKRLADSIRGCLFGAALGDAAGVATEFLDQATVAAFYGAGYDYAPGCQVYADTHRISFPAGDWTDDTDQQLLILQSLLQTSGVPDICDFARRLSQWKDGGFPGLGDQGGSGLGATTKAVINRNGFQSDPKSAAVAVWESRQRQLASNGAVMRTAVIGATSFWDLSAVESNTAELCLATHADPRCVASCVVVTTLVAQYLQSMVQAEEQSSGLPTQQALLAGALKRAEALLESPDDQAELARHATCVDLADLALDDPKAIGYTYKCLGAGCWAWQKVPELGFKTAISAVVEQAGDADTNATVAGALAGCLVGYSGLPKEWIDRMPYAHWLEAWVQKLLFMLELPVVSQ